MISFYRCMMLVMFLFFYGCERHSELSSSCQSKFHTTMPILALSTYGIYEIKDLHTNFQDHRGLIVSSRYGNTIKHVKYSDCINVVSNFIIGLEFQEIFPTDDSMNQALINLKVLFPSNAAPISGSTKSLECSRPLSVLRYERGMYYVIDEDWKKIPGKWVFQVEYNGVILLEKCFLMTFCQPSDQIVDLFSLDCPSANKISMNSLEHVRQEIFFGLVEYGVYDISLSYGDVRVPNPRKNKQHLLTPNTDIIKANNNTTIGINCLVTTVSTENKWLIFKIIPPCHIISLLTQEQSNKLSSNFTLEQILTEGGACFFTFDEDWKRVSGDWVLQVLNGDKVLVEKSFHVLFGNG